MSVARICLVAATILGLNGCTGGGDIPLSPRPAASVSPMPKPVVRPVAPPAPAQAANKVAPLIVESPAPITRSPPPAPPTGASLALDLNALKKQLKDTKAIGLFSKIALKNQVDDLLAKFGKYYQGKSKITMMDLRQSYNLLLMKVLSLVQEGDEKLAAAIASSREAIWAVLSDPKKFATLEI